MNRSKTGTSSFPLRLLTVVFWLLTASGAVLAQSTVPVTVAIDTSRSLSPAELGTTTDEIAQVLASLPSNQPTGLLAFDDTPTWVVANGSTPSDVVNALPTLEPKGNFTQLYDALVAAARQMKDGGVILVATDGLDENSATTLEDVAHLCEIQGIRILPLGLGQRLIQRNLRRLAMLTGGEYLGRGGSDDILSALTQATQEIESESRERAEAARTPAPASQPVQPQVQPMAQDSPDATAGETNKFPLALILALFAILILAAAIARLINGRRDPQIPLEPAHYCPRCGSSIPEEDADCSYCSEEELLTRLREHHITQLQDTAEFAFQGEPEPVESFDPAVLEVTRVLADENMITIRSNGEEPRTYLLRSESAFAVGRDIRNNTLGLSDKALSAHHFKIVPDDGQFVVVDLGSTNGTFVNDEAARARPLRSGDVIRAGRTEFEYFSKARALY